MRDFIIITDSCSDLSREYINEKGIPFVCLTCRIDDKEYPDDFGESLPYKTFYDYMRAGIIPKTSQPNSNDYYKEFKKSAEMGLNVIYICASSGLSGSINSAHIAKNMIRDEYEDIQIYIFDALTASLGQGIMVMKAVELKEKGISFADIVDYLETNVQRLNTFMIVNDLNHLKRGGRISSTAAAVGKVLNINPLLSISHIGQVLTLAKIRGRKKAVNKLGEILLERIESPKEQIISICHGDCLQEALDLKAMILNKIKVKDVYMNFIGPVVGTYGGPGAMAVFFMGKDRQQLLNEN